MIVERLGSVAAPEALALLLTYLDDPELRDAAVPAVFASAKGLSQSHPAEAKAALKKIQPMTQGRGPVAADSQGAPRHRSPSSGEKPDKE